MMNRSSITVFSLALLLVGILFSATDEFEFKVPKGWVFKKAAISKSELKIITLMLDVPYLGETASKNTASRVLIFDKANTLINDLSYPEPVHTMMTRDDNIILIKGIETAESITVLDSRGNHLFDLSTKGRWPYPALLGKEIGLGNHVLGSVPPVISGPISIIDGVSGRERISFGPPSGTGGGISGYSGFLPIGENGEFLIGRGATLYLRTYHHPEQPLWRIDDIGGNIERIIPIEGSYIGVQYTKNNFRANQFVAGIVVIDRNDGSIRFRQESHNPQVGIWKFLHDDFTVSLEDGDLFFADLDRLGIRVRHKTGSMGNWVNSGTEEYEIENRSDTDELTDDLKHLIKSRNDVIRIAKMRHSQKHNI